MKEAGGDCLGLDWRVDMAEARKRLGTTPVMGNLDPALLFGPREEIARQTETILKKAGPQGHVFNLGHGILPGTPVDNVKFLIERVKAFHV
jgi:uroporphyrinogen decarboxylase